MFLLDSAVKLPSGKSVHFSALPCSRVSVRGDNIDSLALPTASLRMHEDGEILNLLQKYTAKLVSYVQN